jgi:hypothetical protein
MMLCGIVFCASEAKIRSRLSHSLMISYQE